MTRYTSGNKLNLKLGVESFSEDLLTLEVIGNTNIGGDINVSAGNSITAPEYYGDGSNLTGITLNQVSNAIGGITVQEEGVDVGTTNGITNINLVSSNLTATGSGIGATITLTDTPTFATITGDLTGTASTATKLENSRNFSVSGDVATTSAVSFDGTGDVDLTVTLSNNFSANTSGIITASKFSGDGSELTNLTAGQVGAMADLVSDTSPELGGDLDLNGFDIIETGNINIAGVITATSFSGDGSNLTNLSATQVGALAGVTIREENSLVGSEGAVGDINFVGNYITATASGVGATITLSDISLGTDTTGDYVESVSGTANQIQVTSGTGEGSTPTIGLPNDVTISNDLSVLGNLNVTGVLTYEDVTNVDSIGIVTARSGIDAEGDINVSAGNSITAPEYYGDGSGLTGLSAGQVSGAMSSLVNDTTPQLGGDLDLNNFDITGTGNINITGVVTATSFDGSLATSDLSGTITNAQLAGSIANSKLVNSSVSYGGVSVNLGGSNAQPAFDLTNATNYPYSSLTGTPTIPADTSDLTNGAGFITSSSSISGNAASADTVDVTLTGTNTSYNVLFATGGTNETVRYDGGITYNPNNNLFTVTNGTIRAGGTSTFSGNGSNLTNIPYSSLTGTPTIPSATSDLTNDSGFITNITTQTDPKYLRSDTADTAGGSITFTANPRLNDNVRINFGTASAHSLRRDSTNLILDIPNSGTFFIRDTSGTATIKHSFAVNGNYTSQGTVTANLFSGSGASLTNIPYSSLTGTPTIPSATSDLTNDSGFITSSDNITGNATTATTATNANNIEIDVNSNTAFRNIVTVNGTNGNLKPQVNTSIQAQLSSGTIKATVFSGSGASLTNIPAGQLTGTIADARLPNSISSNITGNAATVSVTSITSGATERPVYFNDGTTTSGNGVLRMDGSANGMRYRADQNRLLLSNLTVVNAVTGDLNGNASTATLASNINVSSITSGATERRVYFNDGSTSNGSNVVRMDGSVNGMRYRADQNRLLLSNLTVTNAVVGDLNGTATNATNVNLRSRNSSTGTHYITFGTATTGNQRLNTDTGLTYNSSTNTVTATTFSGNLSGNAATASHWISPITLTLAGDVTGSGTFNGQTDITFTATVNNDSHTHDTRYVRLTTNQTISGTKTFSDTISGNINGSSASCTGTATNATNVNLRSRNTNNSTHYVTFGTGTSGNQRINTDSNLTYNPYTNTLTVANLTGVASGLKANGNGANSSFPIVVVNGTTPLTSSGGATINVGTGKITASLFQGSGASLTSIPAGQLTGTINDARLPGTISSNITGSSASCTGNSATATAVQCNVSTDTSVNVLFSNNANSGTKSPILSTLITGNLNTGRINVSQFKVLDLAGSGNRAVYSNSNGILTNSSSDETLKTNVTSMSTQYNIVKQLNPVTYNWIDTENLGTQQEIGFIAQQMQTHVPQVVGTNNDDTLTIDYPKLTAVLTKALQESIAKIESLEARITALESN